MNAAASEGRERPNAFFPGRAPIDAYGNGGFRFADMSHRGSILCLPSGIQAWSVATADAITIDALAAVVREADAIEVLLLGTGSSQVFPPAALRQALAAENIGIEAMSTGAAARTYNILLAEQRLVAAALIAVD
ncbi:MAG: Mth938-like domain-containing protein [Hyphomicrobiaceae bacterium]